MDIAATILIIVPCILLYYLMGTFTCYLIKDNVDHDVELITIGFMWPISIWLALGYFFFSKLPSNME